MGFFDRFKPSHKIETSESKFSGGSGPENEHEQFPPSEVQKNFKKGLTEEDKKNPSLVTDNYLEETPADTEAKVEEVREQIANMPDKKDKNLAA